LFQEGCLEYPKAVRAYNPNKGCKFTTYFTMWIQSTFANILSKHMAHRNKVIGVESVECSDREHLRELSWDDIEVIGSLSDRCRDFLQCIFTPPPEVIEIVERRKATLKTWGNNLRKPICEFLHMTDVEYQAMVQEIRQNAVLCL